MKREEVITALHNAQGAHEKWIGFAEILLYGKYLEEVQIPIKCTECIFGKWFYSNKEFIKNIPGFKNIEELHEKFHEIYEELYHDAQELYKPKGFLRKINAAKNQHNLVGKYLRLEQQSIELIKKLNQVESILSAMSDRLFEKNKQK